MAGSTQQTASLDEVVAIAAGYTGITAAYQGYKRYTDAQNLDAIVAALTPYTQGVFSCWLKECSVANAEALPFTAVGELLMSVPKDTTVDMSQCWDFALGLATAIQNPATWEALVTPLPFPTQVRLSLHKIEVVSKVGICIFDFGAYGNGGIDFIDP